MAGSDRRSQPTARLLAWVTAAAALTLWGSAWGTDTSIPGKVLIIKDGRKLKMVARPPSNSVFPVPTPGGSGDPTLQGGRVSVVDEGDNTHTFFTDLPAGQWKGLGNPPGLTGYKFRADPNQPPNPCNVSLVKSKVIKFVCGDDQFLNPPLAGAAMARIEVGAQSYTGHFSAPILNANGTYKSSSAPACTPPPGCCGGYAFHSFTTAAAAGDCGDLLNSNGTKRDLACQALYIGGGGNSTGPATRPPQDQSITAVTACSADQVSLGPTTSAQTGRNSTCTSAGCLFGAPVPLPQPTSTATSTCLVSTLTGGAAGFLDCNTGDEAFIYPLSMGLFLTGDSVIDPGNSIPGIQPCPLCSAGSCVGGPNNGMSCATPNGATSADCPPPPAYNIGSVPFTLALSSGTVSWTGTVATNDTGATESTQTRVFSGYCRDVDGTGAFRSSAQQCWQNGLALGTACSGTFESCEQRSNGAFGPNGGATNTITAIGRPQANISCGAVTGTRVGVFSVAPTFDNTVDAALDLPGPGALAIPGTGVLCSAANPCPVATNTTTTTIFGSTTTSTSSTSSSSAPLSTSTTSTSTTSTSTSSTLGTSTTTTSSTTSTTLAACCNAAGFYGFTGLDAPGDCGDIKDSGGMVTSNLQCTGLYTGGGGNSLPLPVKYPDLLPQVFAITACTGQSATLGASTSVNTGSNRNCSSAGCLFGAPLAMPNANATPVSLCILNTVASGATGMLNCSTGAESVTEPLNMILYLTGDLATDPMGTIAGIQPCPLCSGGSCVGGANNGMACTAGTSGLSGNPAYPTSQDCPPSPGFNVGTLPISFALSSGTVSWTGTVATNDTGSTAGVQSRDFVGYCRDSDGTGCFKGDPFGSCPASSPGAQKCWENGLAVGAACSGTFETCEQRNNGAFGPNGGAVKTIIAIGTPAGSILSGPASTTLVGIFGLPPSFNATVDAGYDLPGPGAVTIPGSASLCASGNPCP